MDIKSLKDKILQLAIQGKLVAQDENDEPASVLLDRIKEEKERLIKDKVIKKEKALPEISEEEKSFDLPKGWEWCRLGDISNIIMGQSPDSSSVSDNKGGVEFHQGKTSFGKILIKDSGFYCTKPTKIAEPNDILLSVRAPVGTLNITDRELCIGRGLAAIRSFINIENKFFFYFIMALEDELISKSTGTTFKAVSSVVIKELLIPLPPLEEQKRIVAKVDELSELIDELDKNKQELLENISNTRNKVLQLAIQGKLVEQCEVDEPASVLLERIKEEKEQLIKDKVIKKEKPLPEVSEAEKLFELPKGWEWCRLIDIGQIVGGGTPSSTNKDYYSDNGIAWLTPADLSGYKDKYISNGNRYITELGLQKSSAKMLPKGSVLFSSRAPIGYVAINAKDLCTNQGFKSIVPYEIKMNEYIYYFLKFNTKNIENMAAGTTFKEISGKGMSEVVIPIPPLEEQKRIVTKVDLIMDYLDKLQQEIESQEIILEDIIK